MYVCIHRISGTQSSCTDNEILNELVMDV